MKPGQIVTRTDGPAYNLSIVITKKQWHITTGALFSRTDIYLWDKFDWHEESLKPIRIL